MYSCPTCSGALNNQANGGFECPACKIKYPSIDGVAFLWTHPAAALADWRNRLNLVLADLEQQIDAAQQANTEQARSSIRTRLTKLLDGLRAQQAELAALTKPLKVGDALARETHLALKTRIASHHGVLSYAANIFRDWCWGDSENSAVVDHLAEVIEIPPDATIAVLGAGAGRLAYDLHATLKPQHTFSLDANPLLSLIGKRVSAGESLTLTEFPLAPIDAQHTAIERTLVAPAASADGLHHLCADVLHLPFAPAQFDVVVTPWLVDVIELPFEQLARRIAQTLKPGGIWALHGSVAFSGTDPAHRLTIEDIAELTEAAGLTVQVQANTELPYLQSPASRQRRQELTYTQIAARTDAIVSVEAFERSAPWLANDKLPVPVSDNFRSQITAVRVHAFIMSLLDGKRSINDIAKVLEEQRLMPVAQARQAIRGFLGKMLEEEQRHRHG